MMHVVRRFQVVFLLTSMAFSFVISIQSLYATPHRQVQRFAGRWNVHMQYSCSRKELASRGGLCAPYRSGYRITLDFDARSNAQGRFRYRQTLIQYVQHTPTKGWCGTRVQLPNTSANGSCYTVGHGDGVIQVLHGHTPQFVLNNETRTYYAMNASSDVTVHNPGPKGSYPFPTLLPAVPGTYGVGEMYKLFGWHASDAERFPVPSFIMIVTHQSP